MSTHYFLSEQLERLTEGRVILTGPEAQHLIRVLRAKLGDEELLFDGTGREYRGRIERIGRGEIEFVLLETREVNNDPEIELTMAVALPKGDRQKWLIEKLTELGVRRFIPLAAERSDISCDENVLARLRRQVIEASKQCGRLRLMEILPEMPRQAAAERFSFDTEQSVLGAENRNESMMILAHPISDGAFGQLSFPDFLRRFESGGVPKRILLVIGPVGGFTDAEVRSAADEGWPLLDLGRQVYRVETAAIAAAALFLHLRDC